MSDPLLAEALQRYPFRRCGPFEPKGAYRLAVIAHVEERDFGLAHELRVGRRQAEWTPEDVDAFRRHLTERHRPPRDWTVAGDWQPIPGVTEVNEQNLLHIAGGALEVLADMRRTSNRVPILAHVLLTNGQLFCASVERGDRFAILKHAARTMPLFGYFIIADVFIHGIDGSERATKREALVAHVGTRDARKMLVWPYRAEHGAILFEALQPIVDKREPGMQDPYSVIFAAPENPTVRPQ